MYTFAAAQHHLPHPCLLHPPPSLYPSHALKFSCAQTTQSRRSTFILSHVLQSLCGLRTSGNGKPYLLSPVRALGSDGDQEDDAYVQKFTADRGGRSVSADRGDREMSARNDRVSSGTGETRSSGVRGERGDRTSTSYHKVGPGFKPGFKGAEGRTRFRRDSRGTSGGSFTGNVDGEAGGVNDGGNFPPGEGKGFRGGERTGAGTEGQGKLLNPRGNAQLKQAS